MRKLTNQKCVMRDGFVLSADVYLPDIGEPSPTLLCRTPYDKSNQEHELPDAITYVQNGYSVVMQDVRGRYKSEGTWRPFLDEIEDSSDTITWISYQPWSNARVGMFGGSYCGYVQLQAAQSGNPHLLAISPRDAFDNLYKQVYINGAFRLETFLEWSIYVYSGTGQLRDQSHRQGKGLTEIFWHLPIIEIGDLTGLHILHWKDWITHSKYDEYWKKMRPPDENYERITVPALHTVGWFDYFLEGGLKNFNQLSREATTNKLIIGPWTHGERPYRKFAFPSNFVSKSMTCLDMRTEELRWFDYWLKGVDNGILSEPRVKYFVLGKNYWKEAKDWPLPDVLATTLYLHDKGDIDALLEGGSLSKDVPDQEPPDRFEYNPANPVMSYVQRGQYPEKAPVISKETYYQRMIKHRESIINYSTAPLHQELEIAGSIKTILFVSSSAPDTDFMVKLLDVCPNGDIVIIGQGVLRARYRESINSQKLLIPEKVYKLEVGITSTTYCFGKSHLIRLEISCSDFPQFDRNLNTGKPIGEDSEYVIASQTIYHNSSFPSHIILPVVI